MMQFDFSNLSISEIKSTIAQMPSNELGLVIEELNLDERIACKKMVIQLEKRVASEKKETDRMFRMFEFENAALNLGYKAIAGIDEAGRGPLVGSVVAAAVILDFNVDWRGIDDSKKLTSQQRQIFYNQIVKHAVSFGIGVSTHAEIDEINILNATKLAMKRALDSMHMNPDYLLIDAVKLSDNPITQLSLIKGDSRSASIAAASILAKVTRDDMMVELHQRHPEYGFAQHKGYGTDKHYDAIRKFGLISEHRKTFLKGF